MKNVFKYAQKGLKKFFGYTGEIMGKIDMKSETALNRIHFLNTTGWDRERKALAYAQFRLNAEDSSDTDLKVDGLWGPKSEASWKKNGPGGSSGASDLATSSTTASGFMPGILHVPRHNHASRPPLNATGIVLHRTAGHFDTGDFAVGKWGHFNGPSRKGASLGFHFLIGKREGEAIQFCSIKKHVAHVRIWAAHYVGIEFSGDIGQGRDGLRHGEALTDWQLKTGVKVIKFITGELGIPHQEVRHKSQMFQHDTKFNGLLGHRDLSGNTHADSPRRADWKKIMDAL